MTTRLLYTAKESAKMLNMCERTFRDHVRAGDIRFVRVGKCGKRFAPCDLDEFIESRRETLCPSTDRKASRIGTMTSKSGVHDFMAARARRTKVRRER